MKNKSYQTEHKWSPVVCFGFLSILLAASCVTNSKNTVFDFRLVQERSFRFQANQVQPMSMRFRNLDPGLYSVEVKGDSLKCILPYFGRAFSAPLDPSEGGFRFVTDQFSYKVSERKNSWLVDIVPAAETDVNLMHFEIFKTGRTVLNVTSQNRQNIGFSGMSEALPDQ